jgi:chromosomal replication initiation ATPase DnaA
MTQAHCELRIAKTKAAISRLERLIKLEKHLNELQMSRVSIRAAKVIDMSIETVAEFFKLERTTVLSKCRSWEVAMPRMLMFYLIRKCAPEITFQIIGAYFKRNHGTVIHGCRRIKNLAETESTFAIKVETCEKILRMKMAKDQYETHQTAAETA